MVTKDQALTGTEFHYGLCKEIRGPRGGLRRLVQERWRKNGAMKLWKRDPERWEVPIKYGLRTYGRLTHRNAEEFHTWDECPLRRAEPEEPST